MTRWQEVGEHPDTPESWTIELNRSLPSWAWNALVRQDIMPVPTPKFGQMDWGGDGVRVVKTGEFFPLGSVMHRSAVVS
jgi:hypothetical protein